MTEFESKLDEGASDLMGAIKASHGQTKRELTGAESEMKRTLVDAEASKQRLEMENEKNLFILNLEKVMAKQGLNELVELTEKSIDRVHDQLTGFMKTAYDPLVEIRQEQKKYVGEFYTEIHRIDGVRRDQMDYIQNMENRYRSTKDLILTLMKREMVEDRKLNGEMDQVLRVAANVMSASYAVQNDLLERIGEAQTGVDDMERERLKLANDVTDSLAKKLFATLEAGDEKVRTRGTEIKKAWDERVTASHESMDTLEKNLEQFYRDFAQLALQAFEASSASSEKTDENMEKAVALEAEAKTNQREHSLELKQGERDFRVEVADVEKKAVRGVEMEEKRLAVLRKGLSGKIKHELLATTQVEMTNGLAAIDKQRTNFQGKVQHFDDSATDIIGEFQNYLTNTAKEKLNAVLDKDNADKAEVTKLTDVTQKAKAAMREGVRAILDKIRVQDTGLRQKIIEDKGNISTNLMKMDRASTNLHREASDAMDRLKSSGDTAFTTLARAKNAFQTKALELNHKISERKKRLGKKLQTAMADMQKNVERVGQLANVEAPGARDAMVAQMQKVFKTLQDGETALGDRVKETRAQTMAKVEAADAEVTAKVAQVPADLAPVLAAEDATNRQKLGQLQEWVKRKSTAVLHPFYALDKRALAMNARATDLDKELLGSKGMMAKRVAAVGAGLKEKLDIGNAEFHSQLRGAEVILGKSLDELKNSEEKKVVAKEEHVVQEIGAAKDAAQERASVEADQQQAKLRALDQDYAERFAKQREDLRTLTDGYKAHDSAGMARDLERALSGTETALATEKLLAASNSVERNAALDSHYDSLAEIVGQEVDGVSAAKAAYMRKLVDEAKGQVASMLATGAYREEEIEDRVAEVNAWLHASLQEVTEEAEDGISVFGAVDDADRNFTLEAEANIASMRDRLDADDTAKGLEREQGEAEVTAGQLADMLTHTSEEIQAQQAAVTANLTTARTQHELDATRLSKDFEASGTSAESILDEAAGRAREALQSLSERAEQQEAGMHAANARLKLVESSADNQHRLFAQRVDDLATGRGERMQAVEEARNMLQVLAAHSIEGLVHFLMAWTRRAGGWSRVRKEQLQHHSRQAERLLDSEKIGMLQALTRADKQTENLGQETEEMTVQAAAQRAEMLAWQAATTKALQSLGQDTESEVEGMRTQAAQFDLRVQQVSQETRDDAAAEAASNGELSERRTDSTAGAIGSRIDAVTTKSGAHHFASDAAFAATENQLNQNVASVEGDAEANAQQTEHLAAQINTVSKNADKAARLSSEAAAAAATKADTDRATVMGKLAGITGAHGVVKASTGFTLGMPFSLAELPSAQRLQTAEQENKRLTQLHAELVAEAKTLGA